MQVSMHGKDVLELTDDLVRVYAAAFGAPGHDEPAEAAQRFGVEQLPTHAARTGFRCVVARDSGRVVGFAYGYTGDFGQWWTDRIAAVAAPELVAEWLGGHFELVEMAVDPAMQGRGIGTALHDRLLVDLPHRKAMLTTYRDDLPAPRLYRRRGWQLLLPAVDERSDLYGLDLGSQAP
ncbi:MAG: GNAT family N-acetyltransferase [Sporichthyaceae bacterium]|nr:GNAT family N-acetyltransferase [Sporichthyaceae bacterium]